ncbi:MAG: type III polyketide synthase [Lacipirellulaceae bacterium]
MRLIGLGTATPPHALVASDAVELAKRICCTDDRQRRLTETLYRRSGVESRATCVPFTEAFRWEGDPDGPTLADRMDWYETHAGPLAIESARRALADASFEPRDVTHVVTVSCTGFEAPGVDARLIEGLGLHPTTQRVNVGFMGCHGAINGLRVARAIAASEPRSAVLLVATELCSIHYCFHWEPERITGNALFADGSAALVCLPEARAPRGERTWRLIATGSCVLPNSAEMMTWRLRNHGFEMTLSAELPGLVERELAGWLTPWLESHGLALGDVAAWAVHPGGPKIVTSVEVAMGLPSEATAESRAVLAAHGNMSSATVLFLAERLRRKAVRGPVLMLGFGPGIVAEAALWNAE